jgi:translation initiation factor IF-2
MAKETLKNISVKAELKSRPPIVVVMGHVDHGKTTLLDYIRKANIAAREAGGITQATAAYEIIHAARKITFIDTPGHEAFTAMRSRGARVADLAILVVAADEGVKPQTKEAIKIIEEAKTPFVVAITKVDKTSGNVDKARNDLMAAGVLLEGYGGQVSYHAVSAKTGEGVDELLDLILLAADLEDLT